MNEQFATYDAAISWLMQSTDYERMRRVRYNADTFNLDRMARLAAAVGNPERRFRSVHVAGTKGKGSTAAMIEAILRVHGLRTGLYTSPHLVDLRERIQIDRRWIDEDAMRRAVRRVADARDRELHGESPTFFELLTAIAFLCFDDARVDAAVVEVGLGGRLDSTNIITPEVSVITHVSIDHVHQLGADLAGIAREKAGIIKAGVPLVLAPQAPVAEAVIDEAARSAGAPVIRLGKDVRVDWWKAFDAARPASRVAVHTAQSVYDDLLIPLAGRVQGTNAACAIAAAETFLGDRLDVRHVHDALAALDWPGRMQAFPGEPTVVLDGAHNADSLRQLLVSVAEYYPGRRTAIVFACAADKDIAGMMRVLADDDAPVIFTRTDNPHAADPEELADALRAAGGTVLDASPEPADALRSARRSAGPRGVVVVCGSLYLVGAVLAAPDRFGLA